MEPTDVTLEILRSIRDEVHDGLADLGARIDGLQSGLGARIDGLQSGLGVRIDGLQNGLGARIDGLQNSLGARIDETNTRLDRLERRQTEAEVRVATEIVAVAGAVHELRDMLRDELALRGQVQDHERRLRAIERRDA